MDRHAPTAPITVAEVIAAIARGWHAIPTPARVLVAISALGLVAAAILLGYVDRHRTEWLLQGEAFPDAQLRTLESAFASAGLCDYEIDEGRIRIPRRQRMAYVQAMHAADVLPKSLDAPVAEALGAFSPLETQSQRNARWQFARERELSSSLSMLPFLQEATVRFDEALTGGLQSARQLRALVIVKPRPGVCLIPEQLRDIQQAVAASRVGLSADNVTILDVSQGKTHNFANGIPPARDPGEFAYRTASYEDYWTRKIASLLQHISGARIATRVGLSEDAGVPRSVNVSIAIPASYYDSLLGQTTAACGSTAEATSTSTREALEASTRKTIESLVGSLFESDVSGSLTSNLVITTIAGPPATEPALSRWQKPSGTVAAIILGMIVLGSIAGYGFQKDLRLFVEAKRESSSTAPHASNVTSQTPALTAKAGTPGSATSDTVASAAASPSGGSPLQELAALVKHDPKAAAAVLKNWMKDAA